jgi:succinate dehydrogenase / fumarate reductase cytochrome b subunit
MNWFITLFSSTLGKKLMMALTGLFLISFLIVHLIGNLQLLHDDGGQAFNTYAEFMGHNALIQTISILNFSFILLHTVVSLILTIHNRKARGSSYAVTGKSSPWTSRNMGILGTLVLIFLVVHIKDFYFQAHYGHIDPVSYKDQEEVKNLYRTVHDLFQLNWYVALYVFCMGALSFHLWHGFASAFQTLGLSHQKYNPIIRFVGRSFAVIVPALFAYIPLAIYFK